MDEDTPKPMHSVFIHYLDGTSDSFDCDLFLPWGDTVQLTLTMSDGCQRTHFIPKAVIKRMTVDYPPDATEDE